MVRALRGATATSPEDAPVGQTMGPHGEAPKPHINGISCAQRQQGQPVRRGQTAPHQHSPVNSSITPRGQPPALIPTHRIRLCLLSYPQNEAVRPRHSPRGWADGANAARLPSGVNLHQRGRGVSFTPPPGESRS